MEAYDYIKFYFLTKYNKLYKTKTPKSNKLTWEFLYFVTSAGFEPATIRAEI